MKRNIGNLDKVIRLIGALLAVLAAFNFEAPQSFILFGLAGILLGTALLGTCPLYMPFGLNTYKK